MLANKSDIGARRRRICEPLKGAVSSPTGVSSGACQSDPKMKCRLPKADSLIATPHLRGRLGMPITTQSPPRKRQMLSSRVPKWSFAANAAASLKA